MRSAGFAEAVAIDEAVFLQLVEQFFEALAVGLDGALVLRGQDLFEARDLRAQPFAGVAAQLFIEALGPGNQGSVFQPVDADGS